MQIFLKSSTDFVYFAKEGFFFLPRRNECLESYCHDPSVSVTPQGKNFNLGYIF
jgi:hypothetical protein